MTTTIRIRSARGIRRSALAAVGGLCIGAALPLTAGAAPAPLSCGSVVTADVRLTSDLVGCPGSGLIVGSSGVTIDLAGHTIGGSGNGAGIDNEAGHDDLRIRGGTVRDFAFGVHVFDTTRVRIEDTTTRANLIGFQIERSRRIELDRVSAVDNVAGGIEITFSEHARVRDSRATGNGFIGLVDRFSTASRFERNTLAGNGASGLTVDRTERATVSENAADGNASDGIQLSGTDDAVVVGNRTVGNADDGIEIDSAGNTLRRNIARYNGGFGINAAAGTVDGRHNEAGGNLAGDCVGVTCR